jgi:Zn-dependent protease/CBS domain-containing protein
MPTELSTVSNPPEAPRPAGNGVTPDGRPHREDGGSFRLTTVSGIPIRIHFTFTIILAWAWLVGMGANHGTRSAMLAVLYVMALFACVVLHELGHALTARRYGIRTRDIVLYPIGGIATLERLPDVGPELWIALAGPMVNVAIALLLAGLSLLLGRPLPAFNLDWERSGTTILGNLMWTNVVLFAFNMLPAFPMDGGRVLRALLARFMDAATATTVAARIGQLAAIGFVLVGVSVGNLFLLFIAAFVFLGAGQEATVYQARALTAGHIVRDAMLREYHTLSVGATMQDAADALLAGSQHDFPVQHGDSIVGVLSRNDLLRGLAAGGQDAYVAGAMEREFTWVRPDVPLDDVIMQMQAAPGPILVMEGAPEDYGKLVGMLTQENLLEFLTLARIRNNLHQRASA